MVAGFWVLASAWPVLYAAQRSSTLAHTGAYSRVRHPQYLGFVLIMAGFLVQWPTVVTLVMFPVLVFMYVRLARREEREALVAFGGAYREYMREVPAFVPGVFNSHDSDHPTPDEAGGR